MPRSAEPPPLPPEPPPEPEPPLASIPAPAVRKDVSRGIMYFICAAWTWSFATRVRARCAKIWRMSWVRSRTMASVVVPTMNADCRLRACAGDSSSSKTTTVTPPAIALATISSSLPVPMNVDGDGCCMTCDSRAVTTSPAVSQRRTSSSSESVSDHLSSSVLYFCCLICTPTIIVLAPGFSSMLSEPKSDDIVVGRRPAAEAGERTSGRGAARITEAPSHAARSAPAAKSLQKLRHGAPILRFVHHCH